MAGVVTCHDRYPSWPVQCTTAALRKLSSVCRVSFPYKVPWKGTSSGETTPCISNNSSSGIMDIIVLSVSALRRCSLAGCPVAKRASALKSCKLPAVTHARLFCRLKRLFEDPKSISQQFGASNVMRWSCVRPGLLSISCQRCVIRDTAASTAQKGLPTHCSVMSCIWRTLSTGQ